MHCIAPVVLAFALVLASGTQAPTFRVAVDAVRVDVRVEQRGRPVTGLTSSTFSLLDSGVEQEVDAVSIEDVPLHLMLVLDASASVSGEVLSELKLAAKVILDELRPHDIATILTFSARVDLQIDRSPDVPRLKATIDQMRAGGSTSLHDALAWGLILGAGAERRTLVVTFTDGEDTSSWIGAASVLEDVRRTDIVIYGIGPRPVWELQTRGGVRRTMVPVEQLRHWFARDPYLARYPLLQLAADESGGRMFHIDRSADIGRAFTEILDDFRSRYVLAYVPRGVPPDGWHPIRVSVKEMRATIHARRGYMR